jgi:CMP-N,N'-diacetyllegionaminic acid synthase
MTTIATICARGGSKGLPNKNILDFCGKPLIAHTIIQALGCEEIAEIALKYGANVPFLRPPHLAEDDTGKLPVIQHCLDFLISQGKTVAKVIDLQPTTPLRNTSDIKACYDLLTDEVDVVFSVYETDKNPYFSLVEINDEGQAKRSKTLDVEFQRRQDAPKAYALNGAVYVWHCHTLPLGLWSGRSQCYVMPKIRSVDIDDALDFEIARFLATQ